jgi:hypothetical protein
VDPVIRDFDADGETICNSVREAEVQNVELVLELQVAVADACAPADERVERPQNTEHAAVGLYTTRSD